VILESQTGFVDEVILISDTEPDQILALSFWENQKDAERYTHEQLQAIRVDARLQIAIDVTKRRSGTASERAQWIVADVTNAEFAPQAMCGTTAPCFIS
jgi:heme-degrading monooxygenase HmoA